MAQRHTFTGSGEPPSEIQRGLDIYDRDTIAYVAMLGADDALLRRILAFDGKRERLDGQPR